jgi:hypothetical protein
MYFPQQRVTGNEAHLPIFSSKLSHFQVTIEHLLPMSCYHSCNKSRIILKIPIIKRRTDEAVPPPTLGL